LTETGERKGGREKGVKDQNKGKNVGVKGGSGEE
jgi:hypothetical protein